MDNKRTTDLLNKLSSEDSESYFKKYAPEWEEQAGYKNLKDYFNAYFSRHPELLPADVIKRSNLDRSYAYQILNGTKKHPGKYKLTLLCLSAGMNLKETQRALTISGCSVLYPKIACDAALIICINNGYNSAIEVTNFFNENGLEFPDK